MGNGVKESLPHEIVVFVLNLSQAERQSEQISRVACRGAIGADRRRVERLHQLFIDPDADVLRLSCHRPHHSGVHSRLVRTTWAHGGLEPRENQELAGRCWRASKAPALDERSGLVLG